MNLTVRLTPNVKDDTYDYNAEQFHNVANKIRVSKEKVQVKLQIGTSNKKYDVTVKYNDTLNVFTCEESKGLQNAEHIDHEKITMHLKYLFDTFVH